MRYSHRHLVDVFLTKLKFGLKSEASKTYLGYIWWILEPALYVAVLYIVFGVFRAKGGFDFIIFLICAKIPFLWFSKTVMNAAQSIIGGRGLINQVAIPKAFFPLLVVAQDIVKQLFVFGLMFLVLIGFGLEPGLTWLYFPLVAAVQLMLIVACALVVASITPFIPDFRYIVSTGMTLLMFTSGIFFDYRTVVLPRHQDLFLMNPMANLIEQYRGILIRGEAPDIVSLLAISAASIVVTWLMLKVYRSKETAFARLVAG